MSIVTLHVEPKQPPLTRCSFVTTNYPARSVALDGFVRGVPFFSEADRWGGPFASFNHHEDVSRLATRATCAQVLMAIRQGFADSFSPDMHVWVNDCDQDVCVAVWLLRHMPLASSSLNPLINKLVAITDVMDTTAGSYPYPADIQALRQHEWVFEPYRMARKNGVVDRKDARDFESIIDSVGHRIDQYVVGQAKEIELDVSYVMAEDRHSYQLVDEARSGSAWRTGFFGDGHRAYVAYRVRPDGRYTYTIGRMSEYVRLPMTPIFDALMTAELANGHENSSDMWGGSPLVGGSPRVAGSGLTPKQVMEVITTCVLKR